jgi:hypothetical protein
LFVFLSTSLSVCFPACLPVCLSVCLSVCLPAGPPICLVRATTSLRLPACACLPYLLFVGKKVYAVSTTNIISAREGTKYPFWGLFFYHIFAFQPAETDWWQTGSDWPSSTAIIPRSSLLAIFNSSDAANSAQFTIGYIY